MISWEDRLISVLDQGLRTLVTRPVAERGSPADSVPEAPLSTEERQLSIALMRVNHAGEVSAQALYSGQSIIARSEATRQQLLQAAAEERDHLAWCTQRLEELGGRSSLLNPVWFIGSALIGVAVASAGDALSMGFVSETERQVESHLDDHLARLPSQDAKSRTILKQMAEDEAHHGTTARLAGGKPLPNPVKQLMTIGGEVLRRFALLV